MMAQEFVANHNVLILDKSQHLSHVKATPKVHAEKIVETGGACSPSTVKEKPNVTFFWKGYLSPGNSKTMPVLSPAQEILPEMNCSQETISQLCTLQETLPASCTPLSIPDKNKEQKPSMQTGATNEHVTEPQQLRPRRKVSCPELDSSDSKTDSSNHISVRVTRSSSRRSGSTSMVTNIGDDVDGVLQFQCPNRDLKTKHNLKFQSRPQKLRPRLDVSCPLFSDSSDSKTDSSNHISVRVTRNSSRRVSGSTSTVTNIGDDVDGVLHFQCPNGDLKTKHNLKFQSRPQKLRPRLDVSCPLFSDSSDSKTDSSNHISVRVTRNSSRRVSGSTSTVTNIGDDVDGVLHFQCPNGDLKTKHNLKFQSRPQKLRPRQEVSCPLFSDSKTDSSNHISVRVTRSSSRRSGSTSTVTNIGDDVDGSSRRVSGSTSMVTNIGDDVDGSSRSSRRVSGSTSTVTNIGDDVDGSSRRVSGSTSMVTNIGDDVDGRSRSSRRVSGSTSTVTNIGDDVDGVLHFQCPNGDLKTKHNLKFQSRPQKLRPRLDLSCPLFSDSKTDSSNHISIRVTRSSSRRLSDSTSTVTNIADDVDGFLQSQCHNRNLNTKHNLKSQSRPRQLKPRQEASCSQLDHNYIKTDSNNSSVNFKRRLEHVSSGPQKLRPRLDLSCPLFSDSKTDSSNHISIRVTRSSSRRLSDSTSTVTNIADDVDGFLQSQCHNRNLNTKHNLKSQSRPRQLKPRQEASCSQLDHNDSNYSSVNLKRRLEHVESGPHQKRRRQEVSCPQLDDNGSKTYSSVRVTSSSFRIVSGSRSTVDTNIDNDIGASKNKFGRSAFIKLEPVQKEACNLRECQESGNSTLLSICKDGMTDSNSNSSSLNENNLGTVTNLSKDCDVSANEMEKSEFLEPDSSYKSLKPIHGKEEVSSGTSQSNVQKNFKLHESLGKLKNGTEKLNSMKEELDAELAAVPKMTVFEMDVFGVSNSGNDVKIAKKKLPSDKKGSTCSASTSAACSASTSAACSASSSTELSPWWKRMVQAQNKPSVIPTSKIMSQCREPSTSGSSQMKSPVRNLNKKPPSSLKYATIASSLKPELSLPKKYSELSEIFEAVDAVIFMIYNRRETVLWSKVKQIATIIAKRNVMDYHLEQIKTVFPGAYLHIIQKKDLVIVPLKKTEDAEKRMTETELIQRRKFFTSRLFQQTKAVHEVFLKSINFPHIPREKITKWHPDFPTGEVPPVIPEKIFGLPTSILSKLVEEKKTADELMSSKKNVEVRQHEIIKITKSMTRTMEEFKDIVVHSRLPHIVRILQNIYVTEKKNVLALKMVYSKLDKSYPDTLSEQEKDDLIDQLMVIVPGWATVFTARNARYMRLDKHADFSAIYNKVEELAHKKCS